MRVCSSARPAQASSGRAAGVGVLAAGGRPAEVMLSRATLSVAETTPLAEAVGSALPLYLYRVGSACGRASRSAEHPAGDVLDSPPQVPEWCPRSDAEELEAMEHYDQCDAVKQAWASHAAAAPVLLANKDAGVVPSAPRRSLSLSAINHTASVTTWQRCVWQHAPPLAAAAPPPLVPSAKPPLLFRGLSAANLSLEISNDVPSALDDHQHHHSAGFAKLPVLAAGTNPLMDAALSSSLYCMGSGCSGGGGDGAAPLALDLSDDAISISSAAGASPRSTSSMLPALEGLGEDAGDGFDHMLQALVAAPSPQQQQQQRRLEALQWQLAQHLPGTLETLLRALWEDCDARGLFRYDVSACTTRVLRDAPLRWVVQLNEGRATKKRPTELKLDAVLQPFDAARFHFGKAAVREALLQFEPFLSAGAASYSVHWSGAVRYQAAGPTGALLAESSPVPTNPTLVLINVSPIEYGHVLFTPRVLAQRPQRLGDAGVASEALAFAREVASPAFRLGYNALGAYASINHLHLQGYFMAEPFPCELADVAPLAGAEGGKEAAALDRLMREHPAVEVGALVGYPVRGWVLRQRRGVVGEEDLAALLARLTEGLERHGQPFNVLVVDCGRCAFVWPQCFAERLAAGQVAPDLVDSGVHPAAFEIAGHLLVKRTEDYEIASDAWAWRLLGAASLPAERFKQLTRECLLGLPAHEQ